MKKILGILGVAVFALTLFVNTINKTKVDLSDLIVMNLAAANVDGGTEMPDRDECSSEPEESCRVTYSWIIVNGSPLTHNFYGCEPDTWYTLADCQ